MQRAQCFNVIVSFYLCWFFFSFSDIVLKQNYFLHKIYK